MCQCLCCDCWWMNCCGIYCAGLLSSCFLCSCWLCKPHEAEQIEPGCCKCCEWTGFGDNCLCFGGVLCAPESLIRYS
jgi:hypothetical protein